MLLAAGLGTRLAPLTEALPKALVSVLGIPMLDRLAAGLKRGGVSALALNTHHLPEQVRRHVGQPALLAGLPVTLFHEPTLLGTGGGAVNVAPFWGEEPLLLWNADILADVDVPALLAAHGAGHGAASGAAPEALATLVVSERPSNSRLVFDGQGTLCGLDSPRRGVRSLVRALEPPRTPPRLLAFHGITLLAPALRPALTQHYPPGTPFDLIDGLLAAAQQGGRIQAHLAGAGPAGTTLWGTTGSPEELRALETALLQHPEVLRWFTP